MTGGGMMWTDIWTVKHGGENEKGMKNKGKMNWRITTQQYKLIQYRSSKSKLRITVDKPYDEKCVKNLVTRLKSDYID